MGGSQGVSASPSPSGLSFGFNENVKLAADRLINDYSLRGWEFAHAYTAHLDEWIHAQCASLDMGDGIALVAVGGYGRREMAPYSDLDVALVHRDGVEVKEIAEQIWYPLWDAGLKVGHRVGRIDELIALSHTDLDTATALLDVRLLAGDESVAFDLALASHEAWHSDALHNATRVIERVQELQDETGEVAFTLGPDLKIGRGGLRDVHALRWAIATGVLEENAAIRSLQEPEETLLRARIALHRVTGRRNDRLMLDFQDDVAELMDYPDADALMAAIAAAGRSIAWVADAQWFWTVRSRSERRRRTDHELIDGEIVVDGSLLQLVEAADPIADPDLVFRVALAAATRRAFVDRTTLERLADERVRIPSPWTRQMQASFVELLLLGHSAIPIFEAFDQMGLMSRLIPEWEPTRSKPQRNSYHQYTVDRHLLEAAAEAANLVDRVERPDLLVVGALLHDIGKGYPGDHTEVGVDLIATIALRMGFNDKDSKTLQQMCEHHLLLPDVATRRDLEDMGTIQFVADTVEHEPLLMLLAALTEADSTATGPNAWNPARAELVYTLVDKTRHVIEGGDAAEVHTARFPTPEQLALMAERTFSVRIVDAGITVVQDDLPGAFSRVAGVLTLNGLDIVAAAAHTEDGMALSEFRVKNPEEVDVARLTHQLEEGFRGRLALEARVAERRGTYSKARKRLSAQPIDTAVTFDNETSISATVIEVSGLDDIGMLYRIARSFNELGIAIQTARIQTIGDMVVDTFYVAHNGSKVLDEEHLREVERAILYATETK
ncbi:MAG: [protein-PII] uridylyltransferase [Acidimicrobiales bacterium]|nr:MAG: [protein-PII] uridylyltransferase [Acidimicrobiales bacterium]